MTSRHEDPGEARLKRLKSLVESEPQTPFGAMGEQSGTRSALDGSESQPKQGPARQPTQGISLLLLGLLCAAGILVAVVWQVGGSPGVLWNPHGLLIVLGGTLSATLLAFRPAQVRMVLHVREILFHRDVDAEAQITEMMSVVREHYRSGVRAAEQKLEGLSSHFVKLGLQMAIDGTSFEEMVHALNWRLQKLQERDLADARLFRTMALFAPAFGMFGTVAGLIGMLQELGSRDLALVGANMAVALVTTFYGLFLGYLVFRPLAIRVEQNSERRLARLTVLMQGMLLFRLGRRPATIEDAVRTLLDSYRHVQGVSRD